MSSLSSAALALGDGLQWLGVVSSPLLLLPLVLIIRPDLAKPLVSKLVATIEALSSFALATAAVMTLVIAVVQLSAVLMRYVFGLSFTWLSELVIYAFAACFLLAAAGALRNGAHVRVDILYANLTEKHRAIINLVGFYLLLLPMMWLILDVFAPTLASSWRILEGSRETDGLPIKYIFKSFIPIFAALLALQGLAEAIKSARIIRGREA